MANNIYLRTNSELRPIKVWTFSIPALGARLNDGRTILTCPTAGACANVCYARNGTFNFPVVKAAHSRSLKKIIDDLQGWKQEMLQELSSKRFRPTGVRRENAAPDISLCDDWIQRWANSGGAAVRIHDAGDFFSDDYLLAWVEIARLTPDVLFYCYTKEVSRFRRVLENPPPNFRFLYSMGGKEDHLVDKESERHADVFPSLDAMIKAGYSDQEPSDLWAVTLPTTKIGIVQNNIPHYKKKLQGKSFGEAEIERSKKA